MLRASTAAQPENLPPADPNAPDANDLGANDPGANDTVANVRNDRNLRSAMLERFVAAVVGSDAAVAEAARADLVDQLGPEWLVDVSAVIANFEMMTRLADATGARLRPEQLIAATPMRSELGLDAFPSART